MNRSKRFSHKNQGFNDASQRGSVIVWIFVMIALFAAVTYVVSQNSRSSGNAVSEKQAELVATEILNYARSLKSSVHQLQINGCDPTEISFENPTIAGYTNASAPADGSCSVFHPNGGGIRYIKPEDSWINTDYSGNTHYRTRVFTGDVAVTNNATTALDLIMYIPYLNKSVCEQINDALGLGTTIAIDIFDGDKFTGSYSASANAEIGDNATSLAGKQTFCAQHAASSWYYFVQILIAR